jgi:hypothetical protein
MCSARDSAALPALGCPIRESAGHRPFSASPRLIAAVHALHRLLVPRHPPCALTILTVIRSADGPRAARAVPSNPVIPVHLTLLCSFQGPRRGTSPPCGRSCAGSDGGRRSLKTRQHATAPESAFARFGRHARCRSPRRAIGSIKDAP